MSEIKEINAGEALDIIYDPLNAESGLFLHKDKEANRVNRYVGIDNTTHGAWVEDFATRKECVDWLMGKSSDE